MHAEIVLDAARTSSTVTLHSMRPRGASCLEKLLRPLVQEPLEHALQNACAAPEPSQAHLKRWTPSTACTLALPTHNAQQPKQSASTNMSATAGSKWDDLMTSTLFAVMHLSMTRCFCCDIISVYGQKQYMCCYRPSWSRCHGARI